MDIPRELFYEEKKSLKEFGIDNANSFTKLLFEEWLLTLTDLKPGENGYMSRILQVFNDTYYICTLILRFRAKCLNVIPYYISRTKIPSVVMPMVYYCLTNIDKNDDRIVLLSKAIKTEIERMDWYSNLERLESDTFKKKKVESNLFSCRKLAPQILTSLNWEKITKSYKKENIETIIRNVAKDENEAKMLATAITKAAQNTENEFYNPEPYVEDYVEDDEHIDETASDDSYFYTPDFSEAYSFCADIIENDGYKSLISEGQKNDYKFPNKIAVLRGLQDFLGDTWFDVFSSDNETYTTQWRNSLVDNLLNSKWGPRIGKDWKNKKPSKVKYALLGVLYDNNVLQGQKVKIARRLTNAGIKESTITKYMKESELKYYSDWLSDYLYSTPQLEESD